MTNNRGNLLFWLCALSLVAAVGTHIYLTDHHYKVKFGLMTGDGICNISQTVNCDRTSASSYSEFFGIPISILGGLLNLFLLGLLLAFRFPLVTPKTQESLASPLRLIGLSLFLTSLVMGSISYFILNTVCPACTATYALSLVSLVTLFALTPRTPIFQASNLKLYVVLSASLVGLGFVTHLSTQSEYGGKEILEMVQFQYEDWKSKPQIELTPESPLVMHPNPQAKMKIVEFADFLCGHCAQAFPVLHKFAKSHPDVEFSFQAFPLDGECNSQIPRSSGTPCFLARVSHCSGQQGDPWKVQKWIFENQRQLFTKEGALQKLDENMAQLGLDKEKLMKCVDSEETREAIRKQAAVGEKAGVQGTPSLYINGKKVPGGFTIPLLQKIYLNLSSGSAKSNEPN